MQQDPKLPIDPYIPDLILACQTHASVIVKAEPGAGKTTRLPRALMSVLPGRILVLEPRRLAARLSAERVARENGDQVGETVGYHMRFATVFQAKTRLLYITEGLFLRLLSDNPMLEGVSAVILDEFHERHIHSDVALACVLNLQRGLRPDLRLIVMSATIDTERLATHLAPARAFDIPGRTFPVTVEYLPHLAPLPVDAGVYHATQAMLKDPRCPGNILVFLTGIQEIRRCQETLLPLAAEFDIDLFGLTAELPVAEQNRIFAPRSKRMIILATNVAETSVTLPGMTGVIDTGKAKIAGMASWSGMPTLDVKIISQASAVQRAGRAGRTAPGIAYRLYSESDFRARPAFLAPEIQRMDLAALCLDVLTMCEKWGRASASLHDALPWLETPDARAVEQAMRLLTDLHAVDDHGKPTEEGRRMAKLPLHPRLSKVVVTGLRSPSPHDALLAACLISEGFVVDRAANAPMGIESDIKTQIKWLRAQLPKEVGAPSYPGIGLPAYASPQRMKQVLSLYRSLLAKCSLDPRASIPIDDMGLTQILLPGYPERIAKLRPIPREAKTSGKDGLTYNLLTGGGGTLAPTSYAKSSPWILVIDAEETTVKTADQAVTMRVALPIDPSVLLMSKSPYLVHKVEAVWVQEAQRVDVMERRLYGGLILDETRVPIHTSHAAMIEDLLLSKLKEHWPKPFADDENLVSYHARAALLRQKGRGDLTLFEGDLFDLLQADICHEKRSFKEIATRPLKAYIEDQLSWDEKTQLDREVPLEIRLENGRSFQIHYESSRPPYIAGYIQDFYGVKSTPTLLSGSVTLTLELRGPNKRPLQVTSDLHGFWQRVYPLLRSELSRTYPKHYWPEAPHTADPHLHKARASQART